MNLSGKSIVTLDDLSNEEMEIIFNCANEMEKNITGYSDLCKGKIMASLFFEPSTRTRLSFEAAMHRLGGNVITATEFDTTSLAKGESLADMAKVVGSYADIIVIRHPWEGAAKIVSEYAGIPVINGGDGSHEHPTQTLCDLYTLKQERKQLTGLNIVLGGDLKRGRTVHSLAYGLARFGAQSIIFWPAPGLEMPIHVIRKIIFEYGGTLRRVPAGDLPSLANGNKDSKLDAIYITPSKPHELALMAQINAQLDSKGQPLDSIYITRFQKERTFGEKSEVSHELSYPRVDSKLFGKNSLKSTLIMHPLPRLDEIARDLDIDSRSMYFKQAARGIPIRMALISLLLGVKEIKDISQVNRDDRFLPNQKEIYDNKVEIICKNSSCVTNKASEYVSRRFYIVPRQPLAPLALRCIYCDYEEEPQYVCDLKHKRCHPCSNFNYSRVASEDRIFFNSNSDVLAKGYELVKTIKLTTKKYKYF